MRIAVPAARLKEIWDYLLTDIEKAGSVGKLLKDYVDAAISTRSPDPIPAQTYPFTNPAAHRWLTNLMQGRVTEAAETLKHSNDAEKNTSLTDYTKLKEIALNDDYDGARLKFDMRVANAGYFGYGRIYKNGAPVGTEQSTDEETAATFSEDFSGWKKDDLIQIYGKVATISVVYIENMRLCYDLVDVSKTTPTNQDPA